MDCWHEPTFQTPCKLLRNIFETIVELSAVGTRGSAISFGHRARCKGVSHLQEKSP
jgi:hypothetical protein